MTTTHLRPVNDLDPTSAAGAFPLPAFEGQPVDMSRVRLSGVTGLDVGDVVHRIDDIVRLVVEGRVTRIDHAVDEASGKLIRIHTIKALDAVQLPIEAEFEGP